MTKSKAKKKRDKTPEARSETQYYAIYRPWPPYPNLELEGFQKQVAFWLAGIMGPEALICIYHKPKCFSYVIIEVLQTFKDWDRALLGQHVWSEVFKDSVYANGSSYVYYSKFNTDRECQKRGWKRVDVKTEWFAEWSYENKIVTSPYPPSRYCSIPKVETTYGEICMNLPVAKFPEAAATNPEVPPPVNDTRPDVEIPLPADWRQYRENSHAASPPPIRTAWSQGQRKFDGPSEANGGVERVAEWVRHGPPPQSSGWVFHGNSNEPSHYAPPGLSRPAPVSPTSTDDSASSSIWTGSPEPSDHGTPRPGSPATSDGGDIGNTPAHTAYQPSEYSETPEGNYEEMFAGINLNGTGYAESVVSEDRVDDWQHPTDDWSGSGHPTAEGVSEGNLWGSQPASSSAVDEENLWGEYGKPTPKAPPPEDLCQVHGKICSRGICKQYALQKRAIERKQATERAFEELREKGSDKKKKTTQTASRTSSSRPSATPSTSETNADQQKLRFFQGKPAHLSSIPAETPSQAPPATGSSTLPARGRRMNTNPASPVSPAASGSAPPRPPPSSNNGWGYIPRDPWGGSSIGAPSVKNGDTQSVASGPGWGKASAAPSMNRAPSASNNGWGYVPRDPWGGSSIGRPSVKDDDAQSVPSSRASAARGPASRAPSVISRASSAASAAKGNASPAPSPTNATSPPSATANSSSVPKGRKARSAVKKSWADQMEDDDDTGSIAETVSSGWA